MRICTECNREKSLEDFHKAKQGKHGRAAKCKPCKNNQIRPYTGMYRKDGRAKMAQDRYRESKKGYLAEKYIEMRRRIDGRSSNARSNRLYNSLTILSKEEFIDWALSCDEFHRLWDEYRKNGRQLKDAVSIDRIDPSEGYILGNMQFITHSENGRRGANNRWGNV